MSAPERTAGEECNRARTVVCTISAIDACGTSELRDCYDYRFAPGLAHVGLDRRQRAVENSQKVGELTGGGAFVDVRIPPDKADCSDTRAVRPGKKTRGRTGDLGRIGTHARDPRR